VTARGAATVVVMGFYRANELEAKRVTGRTPAYTMDFRCLPTARV
jgi:hypothetical protein